MKRILVTSSHFETLCKEAHEMLLKQGYDVLIKKGPLPYMSFSELSEVIGEVDGAIIGLDDWTEDVFKIAPKLKVVAKFGVGTDNIDKESAKKHGIKVINAPGINSNAVSELAIGMIIDLLRSITALNRSLLQGEWVRFVGEDLRGKTVGLLGFGAVARMVAKKLFCFDVKVLATDLMPDFGYAKKYNVEIVNPQEVYERSDIISIHIPITKETYHCINDEAFSKMKHGVFLINTARGAIVDTNALIRALESRKVAGAALDVFEDEPLKKDNPLLQFRNVLCTPHTGGETKATYQNVSLCVTQGVIDVLNGKEPEFWVNK